MLRVKGQDGFCPLGPAAGRRGRRRSRRPDRAHLSSTASRSRRAHTGEDLLFSFDYQVADVSRLITLEPGDVLLTGTPANSRPVEPGDVVEVEVEGIGRLAQHDRRARSRPRGRRRPARGQRADAARRPRDARGRGRGRGRERGRLDDPRRSTTPPCASPTSTRRASAGRASTASPRRRRRRDAAPAMRLRGLLPRAAPGRRRPGSRARRLRAALGRLARRRRRADRAEAGVGAEEVEVPVRGRGPARRRPGRQPRSSSSSG